ncbi:L-aspartate oxidase [Glycomyces harbinensis]|uniref:L-aspartate oxidase n=1 Tax=Glycomyces harbinensis TaxID=58114 RepID=A0A1G6VN58_9ACTN|nr:L-aspartate oxidase [Glycomyces harbinensis]SDD54964.1 L-aspartate oxidase [Glycomyces harbinensis]
MPPAFEPLPHLPRLPRRLRAEAPSWTETTDVCVIGSGVAGLTCALNLRRAGFHVTVVTKVHIDDGSTRWAQGGVAAVLDPHDTPEAHARDTLVAGVGLCDPAAVDVTVTEGPARVSDLIHLGTEFDRDPDGSLQLTREGGHRARRIVHAGGDATGAEIQRALHAAVLRDPWIRIIENAMVLDLLTDSRGHAAGVSLHVLGEGVEYGVGGVEARAVVLATGGLGQIFQSTTNPSVSIGDGVALALRAGATVTDLEFVQFHPTSLYVGAAGALRFGAPGTPGPGGGSEAGGSELDSDGIREVRQSGAAAGVTAAAGGDRQPLITEAIRGEGAHLLDFSGDRFMTGVHDLAELAPRDVVAKAITARMIAEGKPHMWLDARHLGRRMLEERFPTVTASCRAIGVDPVADLIPVAPAAHYSSGGVRTDLFGRTDVPGLYAAGEAACTGLHGANRLASNSLVEALVFAQRIADDLAERKPGPGVPEAPEGEGDVCSTTSRAPLQEAMTAGAGVLRSAASLEATAASLTALGDNVSGRPRPATWEATNLLTVAAAVTAAAHRRRETRGSHWREDHPDASDAWLGHLRLSISSDGELETTWEPTA